MGVSRIDPVMSRYKWYSQGAEGLMDRELGLDSIFEMLGELVVC